MRAYLRSTDGKTRAAYGWDRALGYWCEITSPGRPRVEYDNTQGEPTTLAGLLRKLIEAGFFEGERVAEAERQLQMLDDGAEGIEDIAVRQAAEVLVALKRAVAM